MRYVLLLQGNCASAFAVGRSEFGVPVVFENNAVDRGRFEQYLQERLGALFTVIIDSGDEEHHLESMPKLRRSERHRLMMKLRDRYFSAESLSVVALFEGKIPAGSSVPVTISGIAPGSDCDLWLQIFIKTQTLINAIYSLPLLGVELHKAHGGEATICAVQLGQSDFRLMAYKNSRLLISRHLSVAENVVDELMEQLRQTQSYIDRLPEPGDQVIESNTRNSVAQQVWVVGALSASAKSKLASNGIKVTSCRSIAGVLGLKHKISSPFGDVLFASLALQARRQMSGYSLGIYRNSMVNRRVRHMLLAGCLCCVGLTAAAAAAAVRVNQNYSALTIAADRFAANTDRVIQKALIAGNDMNYPVEAIRQSMNLARNLDTRMQFTPRHFLQAFATDLTAYPELEVTAIQWSRSANDADGSLLDSLAADASSVDFNQAIYYFATVSGYIRTHDTERMQALARFNRFVSVLTETGRYSSVTVIEAPFGIGDGVVTTGGGQSGERENFVIEFDAREIF